MRGFLCEICEREDGSLKNVRHREVGRSHKNTLCVPSYCADQVRGGEGTSSQSARRGEPRRPPMPDVGTETAFRLDQRKDFQKSKHLWRSEVS